MVQARQLNNPVSMQIGGRFSYWRVFRVTTQSP